MNFRKKLKIRLYAAISYLIVGVLMIATTFLLETENNFLSSFGLAAAVIGIAKIRNYFIITRNEESVKNREIAENDERNIAICEKSKSMAFFIYIVSAGIGVMVLEILGKAYIAEIIAISVCALALIYWASYQIVKTKF